jgi:hypothetical protein
MMITENPAAVAAFFPATYCCHLAVDVNGSTMALLRQQLPKLNIHTEMVNPSRALL